MQTQPHAVGVAAQLVRLQWSLLTAKRIDADTPQPDPEMRAAHRLLAAVYLTRALRRFSPKVQPGQA